MSSSACLGGPRFVKGKNNADKGERLLTRHEQPRGHRSHDLDRQQENFCYPCLVSLASCTDMAKKSKDGLRDIARAWPDEIATREIRGSA